MEKNMIQFQTIELKDRIIINDFTHNFNPMSCEYSFTNLFCWQEIYGLSWTIHKNRLLIHDRVDGYTLMPLGPEPSAKELSELSLDLIKTGITGDLALVPLDYLERHPDLTDYYTITEEEDFADYIYETRDLVELKGKKLHKKKNLLSQFHRNYPDARVEKITDKVKTLCLDFAERLYQELPVISRTNAEEHLALKEAFQHFEPLGLEGIAIIVHGKIIAFAIFSSLNSSTYDIHFEKADLEFKGSYQIINHETAKYLMEKCTLINREQDLGIPGIRKAKLSYAPTRLYSTATLKFKSQAQKKI